MDFEIPTGLKDEWIFSSGDKETRNYLLHANQHQQQQQQLKQ